MMSETNKDLLLVIDFQNVYMPEKDWACPAMPQAVANTRTLLDSGKIGKVLFTQFLAAQEPQGTWNSYAQEYRSINEDSYLCAIEDSLIPYLKEYPLAVKSTYSSMKCPQVLEAARLADAVVLTGVVAECCIVATLMDSIDLGFQTIYLYDCIAGQTPENEAAIRKLAESFAPMHTLVMSSKEYLRSRT